MTREIRTTERGVRILLIEVDGSLVAGGTAVLTGLVSGSLHGTITESGDGDYTYNINVPGQRILSAMATSKTANANMTIGTVTTSTVQVLQTDLAAAALADGDFYLQIAVSSAGDAT